VGAVRCPQIVECSGHAQNRGQRVRTKQRKSIQKRHENGNRSKRTAVETEVKNRAECTNVRPLITSTNNTSTKKEKKVNFSRNETKQIDSE
jgi:hypothetical protein